MDWLKEGDLNTKYFYSRASQRFKANGINNLFTKNGECISDKDGMRSLAFDNFSTVFKSSRDTLNIQ